jgi:hypothetical protein
MKTLIISDIHTRHTIADHIINKYPCDRVILLGDYFDDFYDKPKSNRMTARWLKNIIQNNNVIALLGNHEFNYYMNKTICKCSGYSIEKLEAINSVFTNDDWNMLQPYYLDNQTRVLYTHAGATAMRFCHPMTGDFMIDKLKEDYNSILTIDWSKEVGKTRMGKNPYGGIFWCDYSEFEPIKNIRQIFGHSPDDRIRKVDNNICLDTHNHHFMIIEDRHDRFFHVQYKKDKVKEIIEITEERKK